MITPEKSTSLFVAFIVMCCVALYQAESGHAIGQQYGQRDCLSAGSPFSVTAGSYVGCGIDSTGADFVTVIVELRATSGAAATTDVNTPGLYPVIVGDTQLTASPCGGGGTVGEKFAGTHCVAYPVVRTTACTQEPSATANIVCIYQYETDGANYTWFSFKNNAAATRSVYVTLTNSSAALCAAACPIKVGYAGDGSIFTTSVSGTPTVSISGTVPVSGTVGVSNFPATQPVSGSVGVTGSVAVTNSSLPVTNADAGGLLSRISQAGTNNNVTMVGAPDCGSVSYTNCTKTGSGSVTSNTPSGTTAISGTVGVSGTVPVSQSGSWTVAATQSGTWTDAISTIFGSSSSVPVGGTVGINPAGNTVKFDSTTNTVKLDNTLGNNSVVISNTPSVGLAAGASVGITSSNNTVKIDGTTNTVKAVQSGSWTGVGVTGTVASTQSGAWNVGISGTPSVAIGSVFGGSATVPVSGTVAATQSGAWNTGITGTPVPVSIDQTAPNNVVSCTSCTGGGGGGGGTLGIDPSQNTVQLSTANLDSFGENFQWIVFSLAFLIGTFIMLWIISMWNRPLFGRRLVSE